jgi:hypothetical protein
MTSPNDEADLSRRDLCRVGAGAFAAAAATITATARPESPVRDDGASARLQVDGNQSGGTQTGTNESAGNQTAGEGATGNQIGGNQTGGNETGADETGGDPGTPQDEGNVGEGGDNGEPPAEWAGADNLALFDVAVVLAFLSPVALVVLMYRHSRREEAEY